MKVVVSRYTEDIHWTQYFPKNMVVIYNKGNSLDSFKYHPVINLPNVGREGHTYYHYIYENYDNLEDYTAFLQGNPFDHQTMILPEIDKFRKPSGEKPADFYALCQHTCTCTISGCSRHHGPLPMIDVYEHLFPEHKVGVDIATDTPVSFGEGGQFVVSRELVHKKPREFYLKIVKLLEKEVCPPEGYVLERLHRVIFCGF
jgi:hypothetical protein